MQHSFLTFSLCFVYGMRTIKYLKKAWRNGRHLQFSGFIKTNLFYVIKLCKIDFKIMVENCHKISLEINFLIIFPGVMGSKCLAGVCPWQLSFLVSITIAVMKYHDQGYLGVKGFIWV